MTLTERLRDKAEVFQIVPGIETETSGLFDEAADALDARDARIAELEGALRELVKWNDETPMSYKETKEWHERIVERAREALK